jgi:hypothetical protein
MVSSPLTLRRFSPPPLHHQNRVRPRGEVLDKLRDLQRRKQRNEPLPSPKRTLGVYMADWLGKVESVLEYNTRRSYEGHVRMYINPMLPLDP